MVRSVLRSTTRDAAMKLLVKGRSEAWHREPVRGAGLRDGSRPSLTERDARYSKIKFMGGTLRGAKVLGPLAAAAVATVLSASPAASASPAQGGSTVTSRRTAHPAWATTPLELTPPTRQGNAMTSGRTAARGKTTTPLELALPAPTGRHQIGTVALHLVDRTRTDPLVPGNRPRELMISIWYPAGHTQGRPRAPYMPAAELAHFQTRLDIPPAVATLAATAGYLDAPVDHRGGPHPVVLYSPGSGEDRQLGTAQVEQLASDGYIVVTVDPTHDAGEVEFPDGTLALSALPSQISDAFRTKLIDLRAADASFVINQLTALDHGHNPSVEHTPLPAGITGSLNLSRIGMFGHSDGGATAATAMLHDPRIKAGLDMDGTLYGPVTTAGLHRPFLLLSAQDLGNDTTWNAFLAHSTGWKRWLRLADSQHLSFTDGEAAYPQLAPLLGMPATALAQLIGTLDPTRSITVQRTYLRAFFDTYLRHRPSPLLNAPSPSYPEIQFLR